MMWAADPVFASADDWATAEVANRTTTVEERILMVFSRIPKIWRWSWKKATAVAGVELKE
jgi:hypothetical protein